MQFIRDISLGERKSLLLATATPVQLDPIEAFDLLDSLAQGDDRVLGKRFSFWRSQAETSLQMVITGRLNAPDSLRDAWPWMCNPFPPDDEGRDFARLRENRLGSQANLPHVKWMQLKSSVRRT